MWTDPRTNKLPKVVSSSQSKSLKEQTECRASHCPSLQIHLATSKQQGITKTTWTNFQRWQRERCPPTSGLAACGSTTATRGAAEDSGQQSRPSSTWNTGGVAMVGRGENVCWAGGGGRAGREEGERQDALAFCSSLVVTIAFLCFASSVGDLGFSTGTHSNSFTLCWLPLDTGNCLCRWAASATFSASVFTGRLVTFCGGKRVLNRKHAEGSSGKENGRGVCFWVGWARWFHRGRGCW